MRRYSPSMRFAFGRLLAHLKNFRSFGDPGARTALRIISFEGRSSIFITFILVSHLRLGLLQRCLPRGLTLCCNLKGCSNGTEETTHLRDVWHDLAVVHRYLQLPQKRVIFNHLLVERDQRWNADWLCMIHGGDPLFGKRVTLQEFLDQILVRA